MSSLFLLVGLVAIPTVAGLVGVIFGEAFTASRRSLGVALHVATGVVLGVVGVEILPRALASGPALLVIIAFVLGGLFFILIDAGTEIASSIGGGKRTARRAQEAAEGTETGHWVLTIGIGIDLLTDGLMITIGYVLDLGLAFLLALGAAVVEIPEGFATAMVLKERGVARRTRYLTLAGLLLAIPAGAALGFVFVGRPLEWQVFALAFTAGMLATLMIEEMTPQSHVCEEGRLATVSFLGGFSVFALLSVFLG